MKCPAGRLLPAQYLPPLFEARHQFVECVLFHCNSLETMSFRILICFAVRSLRSFFLNTKSISRILRGVTQ